jgi:hypothetical protein
VSGPLVIILLLPILILDIAAIVDLVTRRDLKVGKRLLWALVVLIFPAFGAAIYLLVRYKVFRTMRESM